MLGLASLLNQLIQFIQRRLQTFLTISVGKRADLFLFGRTANELAPTTGGAGEVARQDFSGSYGYVLD